MEHHVWKLAIIAKVHGGNLLKGIKKVVNLYNARGFHVNGLFMDGEFEKIRNLMKNNGALQPSLLNTTLADEHVLEIERRIRVIKEQVCAEKASLPYVYYPTVMVVDLISFVVTWMNAFPIVSGIHSMLLHTIMIGTNLTYDKHCRCLFDAYVQTQEGGTNDNDRPQTVDMICLGPTGNSQGTYRFMNLATGRCIYRRKWTEIPVPDWVIQWVNDLG